MPNYVNLRGHQTYSYEWPNNGEPVLLLHGGLSQTSSFDYLVLPALESDFHLFGYDRTGHGFTADQAGSFHFEFQSNEAIAYLEDIIKEPAHLIGYSDGAIIALMVAIQRPELVKSVVSIAGNFHYSGIDFDMGEASVSEEDLAEYALVSPDAPHTLLEKRQRMHEIWLTEPDISIDDLQKIQCPVLVMAGDDDVVSHAHTQKLFEAIPLSQLAILPGTSHALVKEKTDLFNALLVQFLEDLSYPITLAPNKRVNPISNLQA